ncbi:MAG: murein DD-endopeptidase MepM/ murein hydrolase activator NlpD [Bacteriovoracaceae bacterium]|jgi:murein DD-endopeptidase MepM/ murein hydrolase activator NlpD
MVLVLSLFLFSTIGYPSCLLPPFKKGNSHRVIQGFGGKYSHKAPLQYGVDLEMPIGTLVYSSRPGKVSEIKMSSSLGGPSQKFKPHANKIILSHEGDEFTLYAHLKEGSQRVKLGQKIPAGFPMARSGCTGWCDGPHLHFEVFKKNVDGTRISKKFKFKTDSGCTVPEFGAQITN